MGADDIFNKIIQDRVEYLEQRMSDWIMSRLRYVPMDEKFSDIARDITYGILKVIAKGCDHGISFKVGIDHNNGATIEPLNLFTFALIYGVILPPFPILYNSDFRYTLKKSQNGFPSGTTFDYISQSVYYKERNDGFR